MRVFNFPELLLWDRAKRSGVDSPEWRGVLQRARLLSTQRTGKQERYWVLSVLNELPDPQRRRCIEQYVDSLLGPRKAGRRASPETLERGRKVFWAVEQIRENEGVSAKTALGKIADEPWRYGFDSEIPQRKGLKDLDDLYKHFWGITRRRFPPRKVVTKKRQSAT
jgi:hypothetical protein